MEVNDFGVDPDSGLIELPENVTDSSQQIATGCTGKQESKFVATGRGGIPQKPTQEMISDRPWSDVRNLTAYQKTQPAQAQISPTPETLLIQASSWHRNAQGKIELVNDKFSPRMEQLLSCAAMPQK